MAKASDYPELEATVPKWREVCGTGLANGCWALNVASKSQVFNYLMSIILSDVLYRPFAAQVVCWLCALALSAIQQLVCGDV